MEPKDKELLLKDLCSRIAHGVMIQTDNVFPQKLEGIIFDKNEPFICFSDGAFALDNISCKPYLFPLSSINEEQHKEFYDKYCWSDGSDGFEMDSCSHYYALEKLNWCLKNHFDIFGLIPMGLAIDATGLNIY